MCHRPCLPVDLGREVVIPVKKVSTVRAAESLWAILDERGELGFRDLKAAAGLTDRQFQMGLGWLVLQERVHLRRKPGIGILVVPRDRIAAGRRGRRTVA